MKENNGPIGPQRKHEPHRGRFSVQVGGYQIHPGGDLHLLPADLRSFDSVVCLTERIKPTISSAPGKLLHYPVQDFHAPPADWRTFLDGEIIRRLRCAEKPEKVLLLCAGGDGRTGTFIAGLIAILEPDTVDPIAAVRERHCEKAVETLLQAEAIFSLRGMPLPTRWVAEFTSV